MTCLLPSQIKWEQSQFYEIKFLKARAHDIKIVGIFFCDGLKQKVGAISGQLEEIGLDVKKMDKIKGKSSNGEHE